MPNTIPRVSHEPAMHYDIGKEYHLYYGHWTGRYIWVVYQTGPICGLIVGGVEDTPDEAITAGIHSRDIAEANMELYGGVYDEQTL